MDRFDRTPAGARRRDGRGVAHRAGEARVVNLPGAWGGDGLAGAVPPFELDAGERLGLAQQERGDVGEIGRVALDADDARVAEGGPGADLRADPHRAGPADEVEAAVDPHRADGGAGDRGAEAAVPRFIDEDLDVRVLQLAEHAGEGVEVLDPTWRADNAGSVCLAVGIRVDARDAEERVLVLEPIPAPVVGLGPRPRGGRGGDRDRGAGGQRGREQCEAAEQGGCPQRERDERCGP